MTEEQVRQKIWDYIDSLFSKYNYGYSYDDVNACITQILSLVEIRADDQTKISFKAGQDSMLKEVKEWIEKHSSLPQHHRLLDGRILVNYEAHYTQDDWQAFLKGLEGDKK